MAPPVQIASEGNAMDVHHETPQGQPTQAAHHSLAQAPLCEDTDQRRSVRKSRMLSDLKTLGKFIEVACEGRHDSAIRQPTTLRSHDVTAILGHEPRLCPACQKLLAHAFVKRTACPQDPKPQCKHCKTHCYHPTYREEIRKVMMYSGKHLLLRGRIDYLLHLLF